MRGRPFYGARAFIYADVHRVFDVPCAEKTPFQGKRTTAVPPHTAAACLGEVCLRAERTNRLFSLARNCSIRAKAARQAYKAKRRLKAAFLLTALCRAAGGTESRKNAHRIISDKQNGILLPSRFAAFRLSAIRQTISRKPGLMPCRWLAPCKRLSLRLYRSALTAVSLVPYSAAKRHICFCFRR